MGVDTFAGDGQTADFFTYRFDGKGVGGHQVSKENNDNVPKGNSVFIAIKCDTGHESRIYFNNKDGETEYTEIHDADDLNPDHAPPEH